MHRGSGRQGSCALWHNVSSEGSVSLLSEAFRAEACFVHRQGRATWIKAKVIVWLRV